MKKFAIVLLSIQVLTLSCKKEEKKPGVTQGGCLAEAEASNSSDSCSSSFFNQNCELNYIGSKGLSESSKSKFVDFCFPQDSAILFEDSFGNKMECFISEKKYSKGTYSIISSPSSPQCEHFCLENEEAYVVFKTDKFSLRIVLSTGLNPGVGFSQNPQKFIESSFTIYAMKENSRQLVFDLPIENFKDEQIVPDTTNIRYHQNIQLNNSNYVELYSNENLNVAGLIRKEKVYFHPQNGLVAVRDSLGTLWTRI